MKRFLVVLFVLVAACSWGQDLNVGRVNQSAATCVSVTRSAGAGVQALSSGTVLVFDTEITDTLGEYDTGTGRFTASRDGYYRFELHAYFSSASPILPLVYLVLSGTYNQSLIWYDVISATDRVLHGSVTVPMTAGQYVDLVINNTSCSMNATLSGLRIFKAL